MLKQAILFPSESGGASLNIEKLELKQIISYERKLQAFNSAYRYKFSRSNMHEI